MVGDTLGDSGGDSGGVTQLARHQGGQGDGRSAGLSAI